ncbi:MAG: glycosyltransferase [Bryobacterales bacterium]
MLEVVFWIFVAPAVLATVLSVRSGRKYQDFIEAELLAERDPDEAPYSPSVSLIIPVRGADHDLAANLRSFAHQDYPDYELIVVCRSAEDDAVRVARMTLGESFKLVLAGPPPDGTGEKVHNLQQAVLQARGDVFAFADSDAQVSERWLHALVQPLAHQEVGASTGFRWYFPEGLRLLAADAQRLGLHHRRNHAPRWKNFGLGGSMALRRATFDEAKVGEYWQGCRQRRLPPSPTPSKTQASGIRYAPAAMAATTGLCSRHEFLDWAVRQMKITRVYRTKLWVAGLIAHTSIAAPRSPASSRPPWATRSASARSLSHPARHGRAGCRCAAIADASVPRARRSA